MSERIESKGVESKRIESRSIVDSLKFRFAASFLFRLVDAFLTSTFYQPDEYFQSWEVAYEDLYGVGFRTWEWYAGIRTSLIPRFMALIIKASTSMGVDYLTTGKVVMAALASVTDVYTSLLVRRLAKLSPEAERSVSRAAWVVSLSSMFNWYASIRPFSNTFETVLVSMSLFHWYSDDARQLAFAQVLAHIAIALRPSNAILWLMLGLDSVARARTWTKRAMIVGIALLTAIVSQGVIIAADFNYYRGTAIPYIEFLRYNFGARLSELYGVNPWHWYITQGVPFVLMGHIPLVFYGWRRTPWKLRALLVCNVFVFSCIAHKEFRFLSYLLPLFHLVAALGFESCPKLLKIAAITVNAVVALYFSVFHQRGVFSVVNHIRNDASITDVSFLMPCHSTPWHSHFQRANDTNFEPQFLTCEPPWNISSVGYVDEADVFYSGPIKFLKSHPEKLTNTVVVFEPLATLIRELGYKITHRFYNGLLNEDPRRQGDVLILQKI